MFALRLHRGSIVTVALGLLLALPALAKFARVSEPVPAARLLENVGRYVREHPNDAVGHYTLGRLHSLAYAMDGGELEVVVKGHPPNGLPGFPPYASIQVGAAGPVGKLKESQAEHLVQSVLQYRQATTLDDHNALYFLGLGWMSEQAYLAVRSGNTLPIAQKRPLQWNGEAEIAYRRAYELARAREVGEAHLGPAADSSITLEAGEGLLRMLATLTDTLAIRTERERVEKFVAKLKQSPRAVTPIVFPVDRPRPLRELVSTSRTARFDLAGDDVPRRWPWVNCDTGILVWDPERSGHIASGRQLFGSATWWIFWRNGYDALAALDDDGDGWLSGAELSGIAVWQDRNGNGVSEPGEVRPLGELGIEAISVRQTESVDGMPANRKGIRVRDGRTLPTYDWTISPIRGVAPAGRAAPTPSFQSHLRQIGSKPSDRPVSLFHSPGSFGVAPGEGWIERRERRDQE